MHVAAGRLSVDVVYELVNYGEYVNSTDFKGNTPLHCCSLHLRDYFALSRCKMITDFLLINGAMVNCQNIHKRTPYLELAGQPSCFNGIEQMMRIEELYIKEDIRLKALGLQKGLNVEWRCGLDFYDNVRNQCLKEFESMKSTKVVKDISVYQVLSHSNLPFVLSPGDVLHIDDFLSSPDLLIRFPLYGKLLRITFQKTKLLTRAFQSFYAERRKQMVKELPKLVVKHLLTFLSKKDLETFIES